MIGTVVKVLKEMITLSFRSGTCHSLLGGCAMMQHLMLSAYPMNQYFLVSS